MLHMHSPYSKFYVVCTAAPIPEAGLHHVMSVIKSESKSEACIYLNGCNHHPSDC